jgi:Fur family ferric uptake transcriptional regulator
MKKPSLTSRIHDRLNEHGYKKTTPREKIVASIARHSGLFSTNEIIKSNPTVDRVSVYRTMDLLSDLDIIHPVTVRDGEQLYELHAEEKHEHHVVCENCQKTSKITCSIPKIILKGFSHVHHTLVLSGICKVCAKRNS